MSLLSPEELRQIQLTAELGMTSLVTISHRFAIAPDADEYDGEQQWTTQTRRVKGWLSSKPVEMPSDENGAIVTATTYRLFLPVGTEISPGDRVEIGSRSFTVSDTTAESTWPALLSVSLRGRE